MLGGSSWALKAEQVEGSAELIGLVGGLLADLGFQVCPIGADACQRPSIVVWVCGDETQADEYEQLAALDVPARLRSAEQPTRVARRPRLSNDSTIPSESHLAQTTGWVS